MVYVELTAKKEDCAIRRYHTDLIRAGMYFDPKNSSKYEPMGATGLASILFTKPNFVKKSHPMAQFSDLVLYPIVKGRYDPEYKPYRSLWEAGRIIDTVLPQKDVTQLGIKYYCFDRL
jgi:hypothetical protein